MTTLLAAGSQLPTHASLIQIVYGAGMRRRGLGSTVQLGGWYLLSNLSTAPVTIKTAGAFSRVLSGQAEELVRLRGVSEFLPTFGELDLMTAPVDTIAAYNTHRKCLFAENDRDRRPVEAEFRPFAMSGGCMWKLHAPIRRETEAPFRNYLRENDCV